MMQQQIKEIIVDMQQTDLFTGVTRHINIIPVANKATICIGIRRSGKSTLMQQIMQKLLNNGVKRENILYLNFFDERLHKLHEVGLSVILEAYFSLYPAKKSSEKVFFFFDEIQLFADWELFVERIIRTENSEVYITGSSARLLAREIATQMRGRALSWEVFPFSFREFLDLKGIDYETPYSTKTRLLLQQAFDNFWEDGSFPEVIGLDKHLRIKILQEYYNSILFRDLIERHNIAHPKALIDLARWFVDNNASNFSINSLTGYLKTLGHKVSKDVVAEYIAWFEDAYFFFSVRIFDPSLARVNSNPKKIYCIDHAMINATSSGIMLNSGRLLENIVFIALRQFTPAIFYYKTQAHQEVDFVIQLNNRTKLLIQVCETLLDPKTKQREIRALNNAMLELHIGKSIIVTRAEAASCLTVECGMVEVMPAWYFLINLPLIIKNGME